jgi:hypothetical protein
MGIKLYCAPSRGRNTILLSNPAKSSKIARIRFKAVPWGDPNLNPVT